MAFVTFTYNPVPAPACYPPDINGLANALTSGILSGTIPDTAGGGVSVGSAPPSSALTNKVWFKTDAAGRPLGVYMFYNGNWRKVYTGTAPGEIRIWSGVNTQFDGTGRGIVGGDLDGWCLCNGQNGTPNLANQFVIGASQYSGGWQANPDGTGPHYAAGDGVIRCINMPNLQTAGYAALVQMSTTGGRLVMSNDPGAGVPMDLPVMDLTNNCHPQGQRPLMPPYYAMAYIQFVGYA